MFSPASCCLDVFIKRKSESKTGESHQRMKEERLNILASHTTEEYNYSGTQIRGGNSGLNTKYTVWCACMLQLQELFPCNRTGIARSIFSSWRWEKEKTLGWRRDPNGTTRLSTFWHVLALLWELEMCGDSPTYAKSTEEVRCSLYIIFSLSSHHLCYHTSICTTPTESIQFRGTIIHWHLDFFLFQFN